MCRVLLTESWLQKKRRNQQESQSDRNCIETQARYAFHTCSLNDEVSIDFSKSVLSLTENQGHHGDRGPWERPKLLPEIPRLVTCNRRIGSGGITDSSAEGAEQQPRVKAAAIPGAGTLGTRGIQIKPCKGDADSLRRPCRALFSRFPNPGFRPLLALHPGLGCTALSALASFIPATARLCFSALSARASFIPATTNVFVPGHQSRHQNNS